MLFRSPLNLLARSLHEGVVRLLQAARRRGLRLAVFSDYPATGKLAAMGIADFFDAAVSAQDPDVQRFKPDPRGLEVTLHRLGVEKQEALYIGDRPELDGVAASRAGVTSVIIGRHRSIDGPESVEISKYQELINALSPKDL